MTTEVPLEIFTRGDLNREHMRAFNQRVREYVEKKVPRLLRYIQGIQSIRVDLAYHEAARSADQRAKAQITLRGKRLILRSEEYADDLFTALDRAMDKMQRRIDRVKGRRWRRAPERETLAEEVRTAWIQQEEAAARPEGSEASRPRIVRRKRFELVPMDEEEAIEQMELLGHDRFFIFFNANTNKINVLYKRRDGSYGIIEPELA